MTKKRLIVVIWLIAAGIALALFSTVMYYCALVTVRETIESTDHLGESAPHILHLKSINISLHHILIFEFGIADAHSQPSGYVAYWYWISPPRGHVAMVPE
jgi:hypothetical protein